MACFGSCGCEPCCMSPSELAEIASSIEIEIYSEDYPTSSEPIDSTSGSFTSSGCCHVFTWVRNPGFSYNCKKTAQLVVDESITISTKMVVTKTHIMSPPTTVTAGVPDGLCIYTNPPNEYFAPVGAEDLCDEVVNCGTVTKTAQKKLQIWSAVGYSRKEFRVAIHKTNLTCEAGQPPECKYVVEAAQGIDVSLLGNFYESLSKTKSTADIHACCDEIAECWTTASHSPEPTCEQAANLTNGWSGGATVRYWIVKYKVYDTLEDIPSEIVFDATDGWPCDEFAFCTVEAENISEDGLCFQFTGTVDPYEGGEIYSIAFMYNCGFCLDTGVPCDGIGRLVVDEETICFGTPFPESSQCWRDGDFLDRFDGRNLGYATPTSDGISTVFYSVRNSVFVSPEGCFEYPYSITSQCNPDPPDRDACNWYDCPDCANGNQDGLILPYQFKMHTVDAYSFSQGPGTGVDSTPICVEWLRMRITLTP